MYFLAKRFYSGHNNTKRGASKPATRVAICGIALGLAVILMSVSVLTGFKQELTKKITGFAADIEVLNLGTDPGREFPSFHREAPPVPGRSRPPPAG